jgi:bifunctional DNase/RNase
MSDHVKRGNCSALIWRALERRQSGSSGKEAWSDGYQSSKLALIYRFHAAVLCSRSRNEEVEMLEIAIDSIRFTPMDYQWVVVLKEKEAERYLPLLMPRAEAAAIAIKLLDGDTSQPSTQDLLGSVGHALDGSVQHILVSQLDNKTLYARIAVQSNGQVQELDSRPSDAIALAVAARAPIYVEERLLDETRKDPFIP